MSSRFGSLKAERDFISRCTPVVKSNVKAYACVDQDLREDLTQEAWASIFEALDKYDESRGFKFESYANSVVRGHLLHFWRSKKDLVRPVRHQPKSNGKRVESIDRTPCVSADQFESPELFFGVSDFPHDTVALQIAMENLPPDCKFVIFRFFFHGESCAEIARVCEVSQPVAGRLYKKAISLMRDMLLEDDFARS